MHPCADLAGHHALNLAAGLSLSYKSVRIVKVVVMYEMFGRPRRLKDREGRINDLVIDLTDTKTYGVLYDNCVSFESSKTVALGLARVVPVGWVGLTLIQYFSQTA